MTNGKVYTRAFKALMIQRVAEGEPRKELCEAYGIARSSLANWISQSNPSNNRSGEPTVAEIRAILVMHDNEVPLRIIEGISTRRPTTILNWIEDPRFREATFEYDPEMTYDYHDLTDRSIVTHDLCRDTPCKYERLALLGALVSPSGVVSE